MYCVKCTESLSKDWNVCPKCGTKIQKNTSSTLDTDVFQERAIAFLIDSAIVGAIAAIVFGLIQPALSEYSFMQRDLATFLNLKESGIDLSWLKEYAKIDTVGEFLNLSACILIYYGILEGSVYQGTFGKMIVGIRVTDNRGWRLSYSSSFMRALLRIPSLMTGGLALLCVLITDRSKAIHDFFPGSLVSKKE